MMMVTPQKSVSLPFGGNLELNEFQTNPCHAPPGNFTYKVVIVGNPGVGKTSFVFRFAEGRFPTEIRPTLGVNVLTKTIHLQQETTIKWIIWDVGSQRRMEPLRKVFYRGAAAILLVFDNKDPESRDALGNVWLKELIEAKVNLAKISVVVVANKCDLSPKEHDFPKITPSFLNLNNLSVIKTSALTGKNVDSLFEYLAYQCLPR